MYNHLIVCLQYILPKKLLSRLVYYLARTEVKLLKQLLIHSFITLYRIDLTEAKREHVKDYRSFNDFFTRQLKPDCRTFQRDNHLLLSPVDGTVSQFGQLEVNRLIQAKARYYTVNQLLANDQRLAANFYNGLFATLYLSPRDYHRVHMPVSGRLVQTSYVSGQRFGVGRASVAGIHGIFAKNERFIGIFETSFGLLAIVMVGAIFVGSISTVFATTITAEQQQPVITQTYHTTPIQLNQGDEYGHFNMGSTVIVLVAPGSANWLHTLNHNAPIRLGQVLATR